MIVSTRQSRTYYTRTRKGKMHVVPTVRTVYVLQCDCCKQEFERTAKQLNKRSVVHVCGHCDQKSFAQKQSTLWKRVGGIDASSSFKI